MAEPPPTAMTWPVTWRAASGEEIHSTALAMSAAVVVRRSGCCRSTWSACSGVKITSRPRAQTLCGGG